MMTGKRKRMVSCAFGLVFSLLILGLPAEPAEAGEEKGSSALPMKLQQAIMFKCVPYAKGIVSRAQEEFKIGVIYDEQTLETKKEFEQIYTENFPEKSINKLPVKLMFIDKSNFEFLSLDDSEEYLQEKEEFPQVDVLFILCPLREEVIASVLELTTERKCMSVTSVQSNAEAGMSLGILLNPKTNKPRILIHLKTAEAEQCEFNPALFRLAEVIK